VGFAQSPVKNATFESNRTELLRLLLTCFSQAIYSPNQSKVSCKDATPEFVVSTLQLQNTLNIENICLDIHVSLC